MLETLQRESGNGTVLRIRADPRSRDNGRDPFSLKGAFLDASCRPLCFPTPAQALASKGNTGIVVETVAERLVLLLSWFCRFLKTRGIGKSKLANTLEKSQHIPLCAGHDKPQRDPETASRQ
jgi:hypothetical protein